jgi:hypothetical protein
LLRSFDNPPGYRRLANEVPRQLQAMAHCRADTMILLRGEECSAAPFAAVTVFNRPS